MAWDASQAVAVALAAIVVLRLWIMPTTKAAVPVLADDIFFGFKTAFNTIKSYKKYMIEGNEKFKGKPFQLPSFRSWVVYVSRELFEDLRKVKDSDGLSFFAQINEAVSVEYTVGKPLADDPWHISVIRKQMTQNLGKKFPEIYDEISQAFDDELQLRADGEWFPVQAYDLVLHIVCRASNRLFIGLPLCRNKEFNKISEEFTLTVTRAGFFISLFPKFLKPLAAKYVSGAPKATAGFEKFVGPVIEERLKELGGGPESQKPFDFLQWMIEAATPAQRDVHELTQRMMSMNFTAMHTSSLSFTHALYWLAARPEFVPDLRAEVEQCVHENGWSKEAINGMIKVDSFLKEAMRLTGLSASTMQRKALREYRLSDGTVIPKGAHVAVNLWAMHHDAAVYPEPGKFDPWRFSRRVEAGESVVKNAFTTAGSEFVFWGAGAHVCAGRYFAAQELKAMLAHMVLHYDVRMKEEGVRPPDVWFGTTCIPNPKATVLFRKRKS